METMTYVMIAIILILIALIIKYWISIYNKFVYWQTKLERRFSNIDMTMQKRYDILVALRQVVEKYGIHEHDTLKDTIEARSGWSKDIALNDKVNSANEIENNFIKIQTIFEKYPHLKADKMYQQIMGSNNISKMEKELHEYRLNYNKTVGDYNQRVRMFPRNIIANYYGFKKAEFLKQGNQVNKETQENYNPKW